MRNKYFFFLIFIILFLWGGVLKAQSPLKWELGLDYTFDNREYDECGYQFSYTLGGVRVHPSLEYSIGDFHTLHLGISALKEHGTKPFVDKVEMSAYYQLLLSGFTFRAGIFDKERAIHGYSDRFFDAPDRFYNPLMSGVFLEYQEGENSFANIWMEWLTKKNSIDRERFHAGLSASYQWGSLFIQSNLRMMHLSINEPYIDPNQGVVEDFQGEVMVGIRSQKAFGWLDYQLGVGAYGSIERDRKAFLEHKGLGFITTAELKSNGLGLEGYFYSGSGHQKLRAQYGYLLYYGNPFLQANYYGQTKLVWEIIKDPWIDMRLDMGLHMVDTGAYWQQTLKISFNLNSENKDSRRTNYRSSFPWLSLFK